MKMLICTVGLPRSGKTTWARKQGCPVVNPDSIRLAMHGQRYEALAEPLVWAIAKIMVRALFMAGHHTVVVDATNTTAKRRDFWRDEDWAMSFCVIDTSEAECLRRAFQEGDCEIRPVIERMAAERQPLGDEELTYDEWVHIR